MKKRLILSFIFTFFTAITVFSANNWVLDNGNVLSASEKVELSNVIQSVVDKHNGNLGIYVATSYSYQENGFTSIEDFSESFYKENNLGVGYNNTGLLFILCMKEREYDICAYGDYSHTTFTDFGKQKLAEAAIPSFRNDNWVEGFEAFVVKTDKLLIMSEQGNPLDVGSIYFDSEVLIQSIIIASVFGLLAGLIVALILRGKMNNVKEAKGARNYVDERNVVISNRLDRFTHNVVTRTPINQNNGSGGGSRGGTTINGGGFSHSSGKF